MALPIMTAPKYTAIVPSTKQEVLFRPFLVKEEKALLLAQQSEDPKVMVDTLKSIVKNCIEQEINPDELAIFDYEYLLTQIRSKSVGETTELLFLCDDCTDEKAKALVHLDLTKFEVKWPEDHDLKIHLYDDVGIVMKYPGINTLQKLERVADGDVDSMFEVLAECADYVYNTDEVFHIKDEPKEEVIAFFESLTQEQFDKVEEFFRKIPKMSQTIQYDCPVCGKHHEKVLEGMESFF